MWQQTLLSIGLGALAAAGAYLLGAGVRAVMDLAGGEEWDEEDDDDDCA